MLCKLSGRPSTPTSGRILIYGVPHEVGNMEPELDIFEAFGVEETGECCGQNVIDVCHQGNQGTLLLDTSREESHQVEKEAVWARSAQEQQTGTR